MDSSKILRVGKKLVSFLEKSLDGGKVMISDEILNYYIDKLALEGNIEESIELMNIKMDYFVRLYEAQYS